MQGIVYVMCSISHRNNCLKKNWLLPILFNVVLNERISWNMKLSMKRHQVSWFMCQFHHPFLYFSFKLCILEWWSSFDFPVDLSLHGNHLHFRILSSSVNALKLLDRLAQFSEHINFYYSDMWDIGVVNAAAATCLSCRKWVGRLSRILNGQ